MQSKSAMNTVSNLKHFLNNFLFGHTNLTGIFEKL